MHETNAAPCLGSLKAQWCGAHLCPLHGSQASGRESESMSATAAAQQAQASSAQATPKCKMTPSEGSKSLWHELGLVLRKLLISYLEQWLSVSTSLGNLLKMQIPRPHSRPIKGEFLWMEPSRWFWEPLFLGTVSKSEQRRGNQTDWPGIPWANDLN